MTFHTLNQQDLLFNKASKVFRPGKAAETRPASICDEGQVQMSPIVNPILIGMSRIEYCGEDPEGRISILPPAHNSTVIIFFFFLSSTFGL